MVLLMIIHLALAMLLFWLVNWVGEHAVDFGYGSTTLFEEPNESIALNFFVRAMAPSVFIVLLAAAAVGAGYPHLRLGLYWVAIFYYILRAAYIFAFNLSGLVSWPRYIFHATLGLGTAWLVYEYLVLPNRSLFPDVNQLGNELWLAILAFLYAAANKVKLSGDPGDRRRNRFIKQTYDSIKQRHGVFIDDKINDPQLRLIAYGILVYESYCRPPLMRQLEKIAFWRRERTTGIMQVKSDRILTNEESLERGIGKLILAWQVHASDDAWSRAYNTITDYNYDSVYRSHISDVMEIIAKRCDPTLRPAYADMYGSD